MSRACSSQVLRSKDCFSAVLFFCLKIVYNVTMTLSSFVSNQYKKAESTAPKNVKKPVFEKVNAQVGEILMSSKNDSGGKKSESGKLVKTVVSEKQKAAEKNGESIYRRIAKFLILIGEDQASQVLKKLPENQIEKIVRELATIRHVEPYEASKILEEFQNLCERNKTGAGINAAKDILEKAFGKEKAMSVIEKVVPYERLNVRGGDFSNGKPFDYLFNAEDEKIVLLLKDESSQVRSLVLSFLEPKKAAAYINSLKPEEKKEIILRLAHIRELNPEVVRRVDQSMSEKIDAIESLPVEKTVRLDGRGALAAILKHMDKSSEEKILGSLGEEDPELENSLKEMLFTMDDVLASDDRFIQSVLRNMSDEDCALLIAGKNDEFRLKILSNVSVGRGDEILVEESLKTPVRKIDSDRVTNAFFSTLRAAYEDGRLIVKNRGEIYL